MEFNIKEGFIPLYFFFIPYLTLTLESLNNVINVYKMSKILRFINKYKSEASKLIKIRYVKEYRGLLLFSSYDEQFLVICRSHENNLSVLRVIYKYGYDKVRIISSKYFINLIIQNRDLIALSNKNTTEFMVSLSKRQYIDYDNLKLDREYFKNYLAKNIKVNKYYSYNFEYSEGYKNDCLSISDEDISNIDINILDISNITDNIWRYSNEIYYSFGLSSSLNYLIITLVKIYNNKIVIRLLPSNDVVVLEKDDKQVLSEFNDNELYMIDSITKSLIKYLYEENSTTLFRSNGFKLISISKYTE